MAIEEAGASPPSKRRKLSQPNDTTPKATIIEAPTWSFKGLERPISPPLSRSNRSATPTPSTPRVQADAHIQTSPKPKKSPPRSAPALTSNGKYEKMVSDAMNFLTSPIQLTRIRDLSQEQNVDTVKLDDILGDPMIKECWCFNFLFDLEFVREHFDSDVKDLIKLKIIHGFWKREDERRIHLMEAAERYPNIELISAYMPDPFGTHHSKMIILLRHDDLAQVVIHTANMISRDWGNMTQAVWRSPLLPLEAPVLTPFASQPQAHPIGSGERFKVDLLRYLHAYGKRLDDLTKQLASYDFSAIRAAFIGSTPSRQKPVQASPSKQTSWGWQGLREILSSIPVSSTDGSKSPNIVVQVSSIATLGQTPTWLTHFQSVLNQFSKTSTTVGSTSSSTSSKASRFFAKREINVIETKANILEPKLNIIFPTPHEIRTSLDGYNSGASIHTKITSVAQQKQLEYLRPLLCHWKHPTADSADPNQRRAHRGTAAPHIKTYIKFNTDEQKSIDWAMMTSANMSKQAWGEMENKKEEIWIQSWETGVVIWPALFASDVGIEENIMMVPVFGKDMPGLEDILPMQRDKENAVAISGKVKGPQKVVGFRMPYDLPLSPYSATDVPWSASSSHSEPDWKGQVWGG